MNNKTPLILDEYYIRELLNIGIKTYKPIFNVTIGHMYEFEFKLYQSWREIHNIGANSYNIVLIKTSKRLKDKLFDYWYVDENIRYYLEKIEFILDDECDNYHYVKIKNRNF